MNAPVRPLVRYHGGKWMLAPWIISHFPAHSRYIEPFGGGASVLLRKPRAKAEVYNDLDGEIVNLFRVARDHGAELRRQLELTPFAREEFDLSFDDAGDAMEQARRTVVRSFIGRGSNIFKLTREGRRERTGFRGQSYRRGGTPGGDWSNYPEALDKIIERLQGVVIENRDAFVVMEKGDGREALHYVDPPYVMEARDDGRDYRHEMTDADHERLADFLGSLEGIVIVSGYPSPLYEKLYSGWRKVERGTFADGGRPRTECLWLSPNCPEIQGVLAI